MQAYFGTSKLILTVALNTFLFSLRAPLFIDCHNVRCVKRHNRIWLHYWLKLYSALKSVNLVVYTGLSGKKLSRQVGLGTVMTSGSLGGEWLSHRHGMQVMWVRFQL